MKTLNFSQIFWAIVGSVSFLFALVFFRQIIFIFLLAFVLASALDFYISSLEQIKIPRSISLILIYLIFFVGLSFLIYLISNPVFYELKSFSLNLANFFSNISAKYPNISKFLPENFFLDWNKAVLKTISSPKTLSDLIWGFFNNLAALIFVFVLTFYLSIKRGGVEDFVSFFLTKSAEEKFRRVWGRVKIKIYRWFTAQLLLSLLIAVLSFIALRIFSVKYSLILSLIAGIFELLPMIGPVLAGVLAVLVALEKSLTVAFLVALSYIVIQQIESHIIVPNVMKKALDLNPAVILFLILAGAKLGGGLPGVIVAIPLGVIFKETLNELEA